MFDTETPTDLSKPVADAQFELREILLHD